MAKKFVWAAMLLLLCVSIQEAFALGEVTFVTKETQAKIGLDFTLVAERVDTEAVLVRMEINKTGKLKNLRSVNMSIGKGRPIVHAPLLTTPGKNGAWVVTFQVSPEMANKCSVELIVPTEPLTYMDYAVELKGYVTDRK